MTVIVNFLMFYCLLLSGVRNDKFNVIVFLANIQNCNFNDDSLRVLQFFKEVEVTALNHNNCEKLLKFGIKSLVNYAKNGLGMIAIVLAPNDNNLEGKREILTNSRHQEEFRPRIKKQIKSTERKKSIFDNFRWMEPIRMLFLGDLLSSQELPSLDKNPSYFDNNCGRHSRNYSFVDRIRKTMDSIEESDNSSGFLIIIFGEFLAEINDLYSPLTQSIKHVVEVTNENRTLIIITGNCPETNRISIPIYARGPTHNEFIALKKLQDLPYFIKNILTETTIFEGDSLLRHKRDVDISEASRIMPSFLFSAFILYNLIS